MHDGVFHTSKSFKCTVYDVIAGLCEYLYGNIVRNQIVLNELSQECVFRFGCSGETNLDFFKTEFNKIFKKG